MLAAPHLPNLLLLFDFLPSPPLLFPSPSTEALFRRFATPPALTLLARALFKNTPPCGRPALKDSWSWVVFVVNVFTCGGRGRAEGCGHSALAPGVETIPACHRSRSRGCNVVASLTFRRNLLSMPLKLPVSCGFVLRFLGLCNDPGDGALVLLLGSVAASWNGRSTIRGCYHARR